MAFLQNSLSCKLYVLSWCPPRQYVHSHFVWAQLLEAFNCIWQVPLCEVIGKSEHHRPAATPQGIFHPCTHAQLDRGKLLRTMTIMQINTGKGRHFMLPVAQKHPFFNAIRAGNMFWKHAPSYARNCVLPPEGRWWPAKVAENGIILSTKMGKFASLAADPKDYCLLAEKMESAAVQPYWGLPD